MNELISGEISRMFSGNIPWLSSQGCEWSVMGAELGSRVSVIIIDFAYETSYFGSKKFVPGTPYVPIATAVGKTRSDLVWSPNSDAEFAGKRCDETWVCKWGSSGDGNGKAAKESLRLGCVLLPEGFSGEAGRKIFESCPPVLVRIPATSLARFDGYFFGLARRLKAYFQVATILEVAKSKTVMQEIIPSIDEGVIVTGTEGVEEARMMVNGGLLRIGDFSERLAIEGEVLVK